MVKNTNQIALIYIRSGITSYEASVFTEFNILINILLRTITRTSRVKQTLFSPGDDNGGTYRPRILPNTGETPFNETRIFSTRLRREVAKTTAKCDEQFAINDRRLPVL